MKVSKHFNLNEITDIRELTAERERLDQKIADMSAPILTDVSLLSVVYDAYLRVFREMGREDEVNLSNNRRKFVLVAFYLYIPAVLAGVYSRKSGLRRKILELFNLTSPPLLVHDCAVVTTLYRVYADFRRDVNLIYAEAMRDLLRIGAVKTEHALTD